MAVPMEPGMSVIAIQTFLDMALVDGEVHTTPERHAAALWLDIDPSPPEADHEVRKLLAAACRTHADRFQVLDQLLRNNHPQHRAHAYLPFIAVDPLQQRRGTGTALLRHQLETLDASGTPAYLTASNRWSQKLYQRLGFTRLPVTIQLPDGPAMWPMWREPAAQPIHTEAGPA